MSRSTFFRYTTGTSNLLTAASIDIPDGMVTFILMGAVCTSVANNGQAEIQKNATTICVVGEHPIENLNLAVHVVNGGESCGLTSGAGTTRKMSFWGYWI